MSIKGEGVKKNPQQGLKWLMASARKRYAPAEAYLGELYWAGKIVRGDRTRAVMWYILARESARPEENPEIFDRALQIEANVGEDERIEAEARAKVWDDQYPAEKVRPREISPACWGRRPGRSHEVRHRHVHARQEYHEAEPGLDCTI